MRNIEYPMVWNNVRFIPEREGIWYRGMDDGEALNSTIRHGTRTISVSFFTYGDILNDEPLKEGWCATVRESNDVIANRGLHTKDHIVATDINDAERQAEKWAKTIA